MIIMKNPYVNNIGVTLKENELIVTGALTYATVMHALALCQNLLSTNQDRVVNLGAVTNSDSSSLAFMTALIREGNAKHCIIKFSQLPYQMRRLSLVSGLEHIL